MSSARSRGDNAPSLFPFLAVLLCTVGALVLMLVLIVGNSQAAVKEAVEHRAERVDELKAKVETVREAFREDREKIQFEIEKKRMSLEALERQTSELSKELEQLDKTSELIDKELTESDSVEQVDAALTEMQKQLADAAEKLKDKLAKPSNAKPVFAIIPYEGSNGTHRRPIYLECRADGIVIQPEGVFIPLKDLKPPYGPGNPLDAALRTVRQHYSPEGALNSSAYPLLVVRSSGIRTYALARMAMAGWDDQFGYELIEDDMDLTYPAGEQKLVRELERTLVTARNRQAALVMAMPGRYRKAIEELNEDNITFEDGEGSWGSGQGDLSAAAGGGLGGDGFGSSTKLGSGGGGLGPGIGPGSGNGSGSGSDLAMGGGNGLPGGDLTGPGFGGGSSIAGGRGGFAFSPDGAGSSGPGMMPGGPGGLGGQTGSGLQGFATGGQTPTGQAGSGQLGAGQTGSGGSPGMAAGNGSQFGYGSSSQTMSAEGPSFGEAALNGNQYTRGQGIAQAGPGQGANGQVAGEGGGQISGRESSGSGKSPAGGSGGNFRDALNAARSRQNGTSDAQGEVAGSSVENGIGGSQMAGAGREGLASLGGADAASLDPGAMGPMANLAMNKKDGKKDAESVAKRKGRNWAWTAGPPRETAVVRNIRVAVYEDRWIILPDAGSKDKPTTVMLDVSLQTSAEELAKVVADRMDRWGYALSGGYWKPVLQVEVGLRSEARYQQLVRLLDGSGLEVQRIQSAVPAGNPVNK